MSTALRVCFTLLAALSGVALAREVRAQFPVGVDVEDPAVESNVTGQAAVFVPNGADIDAFEIELGFDPTAIRVEGVSAADGWQLIPQSTQVDRNGTIRAVGFSAADQCSDGRRCDLVVLTFVGRETASAGLRVIEVSLFRSGTEVDSVSLKPAESPNPADTLPGDRPDESLLDDAAGDDGASRAVIVLWFFAVAGGIVAVGWGISAGLRSLWNRGRPSSGPGLRDSFSEREWDGDVEGFLDRVATLGYISLDESKDQGIDES